MNIAGAITMGLITPHTAGGPEAELLTMAPTSVRVHVSRTTDTASCASRHTNAPRSAAGLRALATSTVLDRAVSSFPRNAGLDVLAFASTSSGYALGHDEETAVVRRLQERWGLPAYATCLSTVSALRSHRIRRVSLIHPPWFSPSLNRLGVEYFASQGFEVIDAQLADLCDDPERIRPAAIVHWVSKQLGPHTEAVVIGGNGFSAAPAIRALEARTRRLVLEANQVLLWSVLSGARAAPPIRGYGKLFSTPNERETGHA